MTAVMVTYLGDTLEEVGKKLITWLSDVLAHATGNLV